MLSAVTLDDKDGNPVTLHDENDPVGKRMLNSALGLRGIANLRQSQRVRSQAHGSINETRFESGREITLVGEITSRVSLEDVFSEWGEIAEPLMQTLDYGPALLKWTEGDTGNSLQRYVTIDGDLEPTLQEGAAVLNYQAALFAEDPRAYDQSLQTVTSTPLSLAAGGLVLNAPFPWTFASSGGGTVSFTNAGNRDTPVVFQIQGQCVNPQIVWLDTGQRISILGTVNAGSYLEVDVAARTVKLNGTVNSLNFEDPVNSTWFTLPGGVGGVTSHLQLIAASFDSGALLRVIGRSAWA